LKPASNAPDGELATLQIGLMFDIFEAIAFPLRNLIKVVPRDDHPPVMSPPNCGAQQFT
jgi:hypothetical protein